MSGGMRRDRKNALDTPRLSLAEAYLVAQSFLGHIRAVPSRVDEPVDGIVELEGGGLLSRVKYDKVPIGQGAVLALLKAGQGHDVDLCLFSVTGFAHSAISFADSRAVALFNLTPQGSVEPVTTAARILMPREPFDSPLAVPVFAEHEEEIAANLPDPELGIPKDERLTPRERDRWRDCPRCGTRHHQDSRFCASCGNDLTKRVHTLHSPTGPKQVTAPSPSGMGIPVPPQANGGPTLRCRTCGSQDIELVPGAN